MTARLFDEQITLTPGLVVRVAGRRWLFRAVRPAKPDRPEGLWMFLPCNSAGVWDRSGWHVFRPDQCLPARRVR